MTKQEFKNEYLINAFFWINKANHLKIQKILQEFNIKCHIGRGLIGWHNGFKNLVTFENDKWHDFEYYQKVDMWIPNARYGEPRNISNLLNDYKTIK